MLNDQLNRVDRLGLVDLGDFGIDDGEPFSFDLAPDWEAGGLGDFWDNDHTNNPQLGEPTYIEQYVTDCTFTCQLVSQDDTTCYYANCVSFDLHAACAEVQNNHQAQISGDHGECVECDSPFEVDVEVYQMVEDPFPDISVGL